MFNEINPQEAYDLIKRHKNDPDFFIIDVRTPQEFEDGRIAGALNFDVQSDNFESEIGKFDKNKIYIVYCRGGNRSQIAARMMSDAGFKNVSNLTGGIVFWEENGLPIEK